jgi:AcrR family transcriptional regulator
MTTSDEPAESASFGGGHVSAAAMDLLWGTKPPTGRGRKPGMTVERIVATAIELADQEGLDGLSMRRVADALGVGTMSLYRYLPAKAELLELMADAVMGESALPEPHPDGWRAGLEAFARASLEGYQRHPWLLTMSLTRGLMGPSQTAQLDSLLRVIAGTGLTNGELMATVGLIISYVQGRARQLSDAAGAEQRTGVTDAQFWTEFAPLLDPHLSADRFPTLAGVWQDEELEWPDEFDFGLQRVLDGIEAYVEKKGRS